MHQHSYLCLYENFNGLFGEYLPQPDSRVLQDKAFKAGLTWCVESAGTNSYHIGEAPHPLSQKVAKQNGIDISSQRARRFKAEDFDQYDKIYALAEDVMDEIKRIARNKFDAAKTDLLKKLKGG